MIDEPGCRSGRRISASPVRGPDAIQRMSLPILTRATASVRRLPDSADQGVAGAVHREVVARLDERQLQVARQLLDHVGGEPGGQLMPVPTAVPPSGSSPTLPSVALMRAAAWRDLRGVAAELLAKRDGRGVHQVGAA